MGRMALCGAKIRIARASCPPVKEPNKREVNVMGSVATDKKSPGATTGAKLVFAVATSFETSCHERRWLRTTLGRSRCCDDSLRQVKRNCGSTLKTRAGDQFGLVGRDRDDDAARVRSRP
jgi:hypothetical protein